MVQRPGSLPAFEARFPDDAACARWLFERRWPDGFRCPGCGHAKGWELGRGTLLVECARLQLPTSSTSRRGGYSYGFDLRLDPIGLDHVGALRRLSPEEHELDDSQQTIDSTGKDVGN